VETYGSYQLLKRLATGGMAQIYLARQSGPEGFEKLLVVKRILPHLAENEEFIQMFLDEARIAARLNHSNIVQIFNLGELDDTYFIAMEYIHGEDLRRISRKTQARASEMPLPLVCRIIMEACAGLDYAHKLTDSDGQPLGIVHRDISPQNLLVTFEGGVKIVDFGIAKAADQATVTRSGVLKGKYAYMSPEQATGQTLDGRSDIFALGIVLYEMITGTRLFKRSSDLQTLSAAIACDVTPPSEVNDRVPSDLDPVVMMALAKEPENRYQEALHLQLALEKWLLKNQFPSSSALLSQFLQEIYAERLAREAQAGGPQFDDDRAPRDEEGQKRTPSSKPLRTSENRMGPRMTSERPPALGFSEARTTLARAVTPRPLANAEATSLSLDQPSVTIRVDASAEQSMSTRVEAPERLPGPATAVAPRPARRGRRWAALAGMAALAAGAWFAGPLLKSKPLAVIHLSTDPPGATVLFDGRAVPQLTPCVLPQSAAGAHSLTVGKSGYADYRATVNVPSTGDIALPVIRLERTGGPLTDPPGGREGRGPGSVLGHP
jgi:serine/threonine protein kinase